MRDGDWNSDISSWSDVTVLAEERQGGCVIDSIEEGASVWTYGYHAWSQEEARRPRQDSEVSGWPVYGGYSS